MVVSVLEKGLVEEAKASPYFSIIADESTDISVHKQLAISIQYLHLQSAAVKTMFLKLLDMSGQGKTPSVTGKVIDKEVLGYLVNSA